MKIKEIKNMLGIVLFFAAFFAPLIAAAGAIWGIRAAAYALASAIVLSLLIYSFSDRMILRWYHAKVTDRFDQLAIKSSISRPKFYIFESTLPAIFTVGTWGKNSIICSSETIEKMDEKEVEILIAHEIGHIENKDVALNTVAALFAGLITSFSSIAVWISMFSGFGRRSDPAPRIIYLLIMGIVSVPAALFLQATISKEREYEADEFASKLIGDPKDMAATLERLQNYAQEYVGAQINPGHAHMLPVNPLKVEGVYDVHLSLFNTHPEIEERKKKLVEKMQVNR